MYMEIEWYNLFFDEMFFLIDFIVTYFEPAGTDLTSQQNWNQFFFFFFLFCFNFLTYLVSSFPTSLPSNRSFVTQNVFYKPVVLASPGVILKMLNPGSIKELLNQSLHIKIIPDKNCWNGYQCSTTICCLQFCYCHLPGILVISGTCGKIRPITKKKYRDKSRGFV